MEFYFNGEFNQGKQSVLENKTRFMNYSKYLFNDDVS